MKKENVFEGDLITKPGVIYPYTKITGYAYAKDSKVCQFPVLREQEAALGGGAKPDGEGREEKS